MQYYFAFNFRKCRNARNARNDILIWNRNRTGMFLFIQRHFFPALFTSSLPPPPPSLYIFIGSEALPYIYLIINIDMFEPKTYYDIIGLWPLQQGSQHRRLNVICALFLFLSIFFYPSVRFYGSWHPCFYYTKKDLFLYVFLAIVLNLLYVAKLLSSFPHNEFGPQTKF